MEKIHTRRCLVNRHVYTRGQLTVILTSDAHNRLSVVASGIYNPERDIFKLNVSAVGKHSHIVVALVGPAARSVTGNVVCEITVCKLL